MRLASMATAVGTFVVTLVLGLYAASAVHGGDVVVDVSRSVESVDVPIAGGGAIQIEPARLEFFTDEGDTRPDPPEEGAGPADGPLPGAGSAEVAIEIEDALAEAGVDTVGVVADLEIAEGFVDGCVEDPEGCPLGVVAVVLDPFEFDGPPLRVVAEHAAAHDEDRLGRCQAGFEANDHNMVVYSTNPVSVDITYGLFREGLELRASDPGPQPGDAVYTRWESLRDSGELMELVPRDQVVWCVGLPEVIENTERAAVWNVMELTGRDPFGQEDSLDWWPSFEVGRTDWPPARISFGPELLIRAGVWESRDTPNRGLAWPIDLSDPAAETCTDVEQRVIGSTDAMDTIFFSHSDMDRPSASVALREGVRPDSLYGDTWDLRVFSMPLREGRPYRLCFWELTRGGRSFDTWQVVNRESRDLSTPNLYQVTVTGWIDLLQDPGDPLRVAAWVSGPTRDCRTWHHGGSTDWVSSGGSHKIIGSNPGLDDPTALCQSMGLGYDDEIIVTAFVDVDTDGNGETDHEFSTGPIAVLLDTQDGCDFSSTGEGCGGSRVERHAFDVQDPGCPECGPIARLVVRADFAPSLGGGTGMVRIGEFGDFGGAAPPALAEGGPQMDLDSVEWGPAPGTADSLQLGFVTDRPATVVAKVTADSRDFHGHACGTPEQTLFLDAEATNHTLFFTGLCAATIHSVEVWLIGTDGEESYWNYASDSDLRPRRTYGYVSEIELTTTLVDLDRTAVEEHCAGIAEAYRFSDQQPDPFDPFCVGFATWQPRGRGLIAGQNLGVPINWDYCLSQNLVEYVQRNHPGTVITHTDRVAMQIKYSFDQSVECGLDDGWATGLPYTSFDRMWITSLEELQQGVEVGFVEHGLTWRIVAKATTTRVVEDSGEAGWPLGPPGP